MQLHIDYARIAYQIFTAFYQQFKCFNHECQMPVAHSVFKYCSQCQCLAVAVTDDQNLLQIDTNCLINELLKQVVMYHRQNSLLSWHYVDQLWRVSLIVFQPSTSHILIHWYIRMVHFLLLYTRIAV